MMAYREVSVIEVREVLRIWLEGHGHGTTRPTELSPRRRGVGGEQRGGASALGRRVSRGGLWTAA